MEPNETVLQPRPVSESKSEMIELVLPNDTNPLGALLGGRLMHWIDLAGALAAHRHSHSYVVTASMDHIDFLVPVHVGDMVLLQSSVNRVFKTSMEVGVRVSVENYISNSRQKVATAYLTFVAVDRHGRAAGRFDGLGHVDEFAVAVFQRRVAEAGTVGLVDEAYPDVGDRVLGRETSFDHSQIPGRGRRSSDGRPVDGRAVAGTIFPRRRREAQVLREQERVAGTVQAPERDDFLMR